MTIDLSNKRFWGLSSVVLNATTLKGYVNQEECPEGYKAVPKDDVVPIFGDNSNANVCMKCDWRKQCIENASVPCMSISRKDGVGVVFKKV
jgi:hypothetical protein